MAIQRIEFGRTEAVHGCGCGGMHGGHGAGAATVSAPAAAPAPADAPAPSAAGVTELLVDGMTCGHCVRAVTTELGALDTVTDVEVDLVPEGVSRVRVHAAGPLDAAAVAAAIDEAGYSLHVG